MFALTSDGKPQILVWERHVGVLVLWGRRGERAKRKWASLESGKVKQGFTRLERGVPGGS